MQKEYNDWLRSGLFKEFYPNLTGDWEKDKKEWEVIYNDKNC